MAASSSSNLHDSCYSLNILYILPRQKNSWEALTSLSSVLSRLIWLKEAEPQVSLKLSPKKVWNTGFIIRLKWSHEDSRMGTEETQCWGGRQWWGLAQESSDKYCFQTQCSSRTRYSCHPSAWNLSWLILLFLPILHISVPLCHPSHLALTLLVGSFSCSIDMQLAMILRISGFQWSE